MEKKRSVAIATVLCLILFVSLAFEACATEESALKEKYEQAGFDAQPFPFVSAGVDKELVDFAYNGLKNANSSNLEQIFVITFNSVEDAKNYYDAHSEDKDKPNMMRISRAVIYGSKSAVELY